MNKRHGKQLPKDLEQLGKEIIAADGTFFTAAADIAWAVGYRNQHATKHKARLDVHANVSTWLPEVITVPDPGEGEAHSAAQNVKEGCIHLYDRGYGSFELVAAHYKPKGDELELCADFVLRVKQDHFIFAACEDRDSGADGIISDRIGRLTGSKNKKAPPVQLREVIFESPTQDGGVVRLLTTLLDVPADVIGLLYRYRWQVELFFRWLKCYANFDHLISHSRHGVQLQFYVVVVGMLLMYLHTGSRPNSYAIPLLQMVASGAATLEDVMPILRERDRPCERDRKSRAARAARKKAEGK